MKKRFTEEQIIRVLREAERQGMPIKDLCKRHNITVQTLYRWRNRFGGMDVDESRRLKELESAGGSFLLDPMINPPALALGGKEPLPLLTSEVAGEPGSKTEMRNGRAEARLTHPP